MGVVAGVLLYLVSKPSHPISMRLDGYPPSYREQTFSPASPLGDGVSTSLIPFLVLLRARRIFRAQLGHCGQPSFTVRYSMIIFPED